MEKRVINRNRFGVLQRRIPVVNGSNFLVSINIEKKRYCYSTAMTVFKVMLPAEVVKKAEKPQ